MKIIATLLVRNEAELVADCLQHHLNQGIAGFFVTDHLSSDGLADVLVPFRDVILGFDRVTDDAYRQDVWVTRMARRAAEKEPDWIVHLDADERWHGFDALRLVPNYARWIRTGHWRNHLPLSAKLPSPFDPRMMPYFEIPGRTGCHEPRFVRFGSGSGGKVIHRPSDDVCVGIGNHWLHGRKETPYCLDFIEVHHYPIRSLDQFRRKVVNGAAAIEAGRWPAGIGAHWISWRDCDREGRLDTIFREFMVDESEIQERLCNRTLFLRN